MVNFWIERGMQLVEKELLIVDNFPDTKQWYHKMSPRLPVMFTKNRKLKRVDDYGPKIGEAYHLRLTKHGIEAIVNAPRKYHRLPFYVILDEINQPYEPFWIVFYA